VTGVLDGPLQTVRIAENFVKWTVEDAGPYSIVYSTLAVKFSFAFAYFTHLAALPQGRGAPDSITGKPSSSACTLPPYFLVSSRFKI